MVPPKYELRKRDVWNLKRQRDNYSSSIITFNDDFKLETSGYWKSLKPNEIGQNKMVMKYMENMGKHNKNLA